jgi:hypothetical protein
MNEIDTSEPILYSEIEDKYSNLLQKKRIFDTSINEISQLMDNLSFDEPSNISLVKTKFENVKNQMNKISKGINSLSNLISDDDIANFIKLRTLSEGISKKFKRANSKFQNTIINAQKNLEEQLSINSDISTIDKSSEVSMNNIYNLKKDLLPQTQNPLINKNRIERLKKVKKEYQQIYDITNSLNQLSEDIKVNTLNQDKQIEIINTNMDEIEANIHKGNKELKKYKDENMSDNTVYYKYIGIIIIVIILFALLIYYKVYYSESGEISPKVQEKNFGNNLK